MDLDLIELKKNNKTSYLAGEYERLLVEEKKVNDMVAEDISLRDLADEELLNIKFQKEGIERQLEEIMKNEKEEEEFPNEIILEVRAGAGGDEASLFAWELARMYERYAEIKGWAMRALNESQNDIGGYKEASFEIRGKDVYKE